MMVAIDKSHQEWGKLAVQAGKEGLPAPEGPDIDKLYQQALTWIRSVMTEPKRSADIQLGPEQSPTGQQRSPNTTPSPTQVRPQFREDYE